MLIVIDSSPCSLSLRNRSMFNYEMPSKQMFLYKNLFFSISSVISIPIMLIGINGGYFPAICRVCLLILSVFSYLSCFLAQQNWLWKLNSTEIWQLATILELFCALIVAIVFNNFCSFGVAFIWSTVPVAFIVVDLNSLKLSSNNNLW